MPILCDWRQGHCVARARWGKLGEGEKPVYAAMVSDIWTLGKDASRRAALKLYFSVVWFHERDIAPDVFFCFPAHTYGRGKYLVFTNYDIILREDFYVVVCVRGIGRRNQDFPSGNEGITPQFFFCPAGGIFAAAGSKVAND